MTRIRPALLVVVVIVAITLTACAGTNQQCNGTTPTTAGLVVCPTPTTTPKPHKVLVIGDSITNISSPQLTAALSAAGFTPTISGHSGYSVLDTSITNRPTLATIVDSFVSSGLDPDIVILEGGTNDVSSIRAGRATAADYLARMVAFRNAFPRACVLATTITQHRFDTTFNAVSGPMDTALVSGFSRIVPWDAAEFASRPGDGTMPWVEITDQIHPTDPIGRTALAGLMRDGANVCEAAIS